MSDNNSEGGGVKGCLGEIVWCICAGAVILLFVWPNITGYIGVKKAKEKAPGTYVLIEDGTPRSTTYTLNQDGTVDFKSAFDSDQGTWEVTKPPFYWPHGDIDLVMKVGPTRWRCTDYYGQKDPLFGNGTGDRAGDLMELQKE